MRVALGDYLKATFPMTNPVFQGSIERLIETPGGLFHDPYINVRLPFRIAETEESRFQAVKSDYKPYVHQQLAYDRLLGEDGRSTLVATGTGSGKTECFLYPVLEYCYAHRGEPGIKALIIYPMNALASDQAKRISKLIYNSPELKDNVTAGIYVGGKQENASKTMTEHEIITDHETMIASPPDILLTNYKMLDYLLVRPKDAQLWKGNQPETLKYIVVDELHTFDGAQGTDLACLLRRLKSRLYTQPGHLCCVGTSATLGDENSGTLIKDYAEKIFGEPFETDSVITEDRLSTQEFFAGHEIVDYTFPTVEDAEDLESFIGEENKTTFLLKAGESWLQEPLTEQEILSDDGRVALANTLMGHHFMHSVMEVIDGGFIQPKEIIEVLTEKYVQLVEFNDPSITIDSFLALISHARTRDIKGNLRPFLHVQAQVWIRELRRLLAKVSPDNISFALASDLNDEQAKHYLPAVNCRDCGETGWVSYRAEDAGSLLIKDLDKFYNLYFRADGKVEMIFPCGENEDESSNPFRIKLRFCPNCLQVQSPDKGAECTSCKKTTMLAWRPVQLDTTGSSRRKSYVCPSCGSAGGISIMGLQAVTAISALLSQIYSSHYNDDKKLLAFSDNVQDAAHRAGFFNSRTWNFSLRSAMQQFILDSGEQLSLTEFASQFPIYWQEKLTPEKFVGTFIPPNLTWMHSFEEMIEKGSLGSDAGVIRLLNNLRRRLEYEVFLEFGLESRLGRTLEKSGCSTLALDRTLLDQTRPKLLERLRNEVGELRNLSDMELDRIIAGWLYRFKINGAINIPLYEQYLGGGGQAYLLSNRHISWMPGQRKVPKFIVLNNNHGYKNFDTLKSQSWYDRWIQKHIEFDIVVRPELFADIAAILIEELRNNKILSEALGPKGMQIWGLNPNAFKVSGNVFQMVCSKCGNNISIAEEDSQLWENNFCIRDGCMGVLNREVQPKLDYYGKLYSRGEITRIFAQEHTGLLERDAREKLENEFKRDKAQRKPWDPNLLSSTPTLEMGIDIGDLSTVVLCSIPPGQSQYVQRVGRAGRKDGNSLTIAVANAQPHDLFFYSEPIEMIAGGVQPPDVFLNASAVLERQFVAFAMDNWVKSGIEEQAVPRKLGACLNKLKKTPIDFFPFNFLNYVQTNIGTLYRKFIVMFEEHLTKESINALNLFARGEDLVRSPMHVKVLDAFLSISEQRGSLRKNIRDLKKMIDELEKKPEDSSFEEELKGLNDERNALTAVVRGINNKNIFNFLSEEGLLPNYAFPESGIVLKAILYRSQQPDEKGESKQRYERVLYEYQRAASAAISELAPANNFYAGGRKLTVDQIDLSTRQVTKWRLCPNCSYAEEDVTGRNVASCPRCGSVEWTDSGQVRSMLRVQMVYSEEDYNKSLIGDEERRSRTFYLKQMLVDVKDEDILSAYRVGTEENPFGYEFVRKATLREINFGENDIVGEKLSVAGVEDVRTGFKICSSCGKVQPKDEKVAKHSMTCRARKQLLNNPFEECLFLYREFDTEALRILIPSTTADWSTSRLESFVAGFMLGMRSYFGNVDHLNVCITEVPVSESGFRKQYLVVYDSVPGGTGYLKQLMDSKRGLMTILEQAIEVMENCSCKDDPQKDGCYRCLYAYRLSRNIGKISRKEALDLLRKIVANKDEVEMVNGLDQIAVNKLFESELERQFVAAFKRMEDEGKPVRIDETIVNNTKGYSLKAGNQLWTIQLQVDMDERLGIAEPSRVDFLFRPQLSDSKHKPVAVFTDGFQFHKDSVSSDTLKRQAIARTGNYRVWTLSWRDVQQVFKDQGDYCPKVLIPEEMPSGMRMYKPFIQNQHADELEPDKLSAFDLLVYYLSSPKAELLFETHAKAYGLSLLQPSEMKKEDSFASWFKKISPVKEVFMLREEPLNFGDIIFGEWIPPRSHGLKILAGISSEEMRTLQQNALTVSTIIFDDRDERDSRFERNWNAFWHFTNVMQFIPTFAYATMTGLDNEIYASISDVVQTDEVVPESATSEWKETLEHLFDDLARRTAYALEEQGAPPPSNLGFEIMSNDKIIAAAEIVWENEKVAWLLAEQEVYKSIFEERGWTVFVGEDIPHIEKLRQEA